MTREAELERARTAGYHRDYQAYVLAFWGREKASLQDMEEALSEGFDARLAGVPCSCRDCTKAPK